MLIGLVAATAFVMLAIIAAFWYSSLAVPPAVQRNLFWQLCAKLYPDFSFPNVGRDTTKTFHMLLSGMGVFAVVLTIWSVSAGTMRALWLLKLPAAAAGWQDAAKCWSSGCAWQVPAFTAVQILRAAGGVLLICLAGGLAGGFLGFLFGIPTRIAGASGKPDPKPDPKTESGKSEDHGKSNYALSTNLTQISDWLTKAIIGAGLVDAKSLLASFGKLSSWAATWLFESRHGSPAVIGGALAGGIIFGFLYFYLFTQLILSRLIAEADRALGSLAGATRSLRSIKSLRRALAPPIRRTSSPNDVVESPSPADIVAAMAYYSIPLDDILANPAVSDLELLSWARSRALLNEYREAAQAYLMLLGRIRL